MEKNEIAEKHKHSSDINSSLQICHLINQSESTIFRNLDLPK
jgi:hypothetical protein